MEITEEEVQTALKMMKKGRAPGIDEVCTEMIIAAGKVRISWTQRLFNVCTVCTRESLIPEDCRIGLVVPTWKRKGDVQDLGSTETLHS